MAISKIRDNLILSGSYERALFGKAIQEGFCEFEHNYELSAILSGKGAFNEDDAKKMEEWYYNTYYKHNRYKTSALQMMLIHDKTTLIGTRGEWVTDKLNATGVVSAITVKDISKEANNLYSDPASVEYANYLRPYIIDYLLNNFHWVDIPKLKKLGISKRQLISAMFDISIPNNEGEIADDLFLRIKQYFEEKLSSFIDPSWSQEEKRDSEYMFRFMYFDHAPSMATAELMSLLEESALNNATLMQNKFRFENFQAGTGDLIDTNDGTLEAYKILKLSYESIIGALPKLSSITDVLRIKENKYYEISRLRSVLSEVEQELREGRESAFKKAENDIRLAIKDLNKGKATARVAKWTTYMSMPISIVESLLTALPIVGLTIAAIGTATTLRSDNVTKRNNWLQVIR